MTDAHPPVELTVVDTENAEWGRIPVPEIDTELDAIRLIVDQDTGLEVTKMIYRAGFINPWHTHGCAHGMYVLDGTLRTHNGDFGPGSFVWFPEGGSMYHGATEDKDCVFLFITNKPFSIHYPAESR